MIARRCFAPILALACVASEASAQPVERTNGLAMQAEPVSDAELADQRGGFRLGQLDISVGAEIRSYVGDALVMQTNLRWTDVATRVQRVFSAGLSQDAADGLATGMLAGSNLKINLGDETVFTANQGQTAFIQRTNGTIQNIIVNTASNLDLRQQVDITIDIGGFAPFRSNLVTARIGTALASLRGTSMLAGRLN